MIAIDFSPPIDDDFSLQSSVKAKLLTQHVARHLAGQGIDVSILHGVRHLLIRMQPVTASFCSFHVELSWRRVILCLPTPSYVSRIRHLLWMCLLVYSSRKLIW